MAVRSWDMLIRRAVIASGGTSTPAIAVPRNVATMTIWMPSALTTDTAFQIDSLVPNAEDVTDVWAAAKYLDLTTPATPKILTGILFTANTALTLYNGIF